MILHQELSLLLWRSTVKSQTEKVIVKKKRINTIYNEETFGQNSWFDLDVHKLSNFTKEEKIAKAKRLAQWAINEEKAYSVEQWCIYIAQMNDSTLYRWGKEIQEVQYFIDIASQAIGLRREAQASGIDPHKRLDRAAIMPYLHHFLDRYKRHEVFMAELSKKSEDKPQNITVVLDKYPESPIVKDKDNG